jgi:hypothetical protein
LIRFQADAGLRHRPGGSAPQSHGKLRFSLETAIAREGVTVELVKMDMSFNRGVELTSPGGEMEKRESGGASEDCATETYAGKLRIGWDDSAAVTAMGQMPVFIDFLKTSGLWDGLVADCPLRYKSLNAPSHVDVLGTLLMSVLAGQNRYAHISGLRGDGVNPELLGMRKVMSEDSARRVFKQASPEETRAWLKQHLKQTYEPLLEHAWVMDLDRTVKPLYGEQEKAVKGYNPSKPGRPSHVIHTYLMSRLRLGLGAEVQAGNETASSHAQPGFWDYFDTLPRESRPVFMRGDIGWGSERMMQEAEQREQAYFIQDSPKRQNQGTAGEQLRDGPMGVRRPRLGRDLERSTVGRLEQKAPGDPFTAALAGGSAGGQAQRERPHGADGTGNGLGENRRSAL